MGLLLSDSPIFFVFIRFSFYRFLSSGQKRFLCDMLVAFDMAINATNIMINIYKYIKSNDENAVLMAIKMVDRYCLVIPYYKNGHTDLV